MNGAAQSDSIYAALRRGQVSLMREYKRLTRENAWLNEQFKRTKGIRLKERGVRDYARMLARDVSQTSSASFIK